MQQGALFYEEFLDAIRDAVRALGGAKKVGARLWPGKARSEQYLLDCLNPSRRERLIPEELVTIARWAKEEVGCHSIAHYFCDATGYERAKPISPADEITALQTAFVDSVRVQRQIAERLEAIQASLRK